MIHHRAARGLQFTGAAGLLLIAAMITPARAENAPEAVKILRETFEFQNSLKSYTYDMEVSTKIEMQGMKIDMPMKSKMAFEAPNKIAQVAEPSQMMGMGAGMAMSVYSDGEKMTMYLPATQTYSVEAAPATLADFQSAQAGAGDLDPFGGFGAAMFSGAGGADEFLASVRNAVYVGEESIAGVATHHLKFDMSEGGMSVPVRMWIDKGDAPKLRRLIPDIGGMMQSMFGGGADDPGAEQCRNELNKIDGTKEMWALEHGKNPGARPTWEDLVGPSLYLKTRPVCPSGSEYTINVVGKDPICPSGLPGHSLSETGGGDDAGLGALGGPEMAALFKDMKMEMQFNFSNYTLNEDVPDDRFKFVPPPGSQKVDDIMQSLMEGISDPGGAALEDYGDESASAPEEAVSLIGKPAPGFILDLLDGGSFDLAAQKGKNVVVLDFWATWCGPCVRAMPVVESTVESYKGKGVVLIAVNIQESPDRVKGFIKDRKLNVTVAMDRKAEVAELYKAMSIPMTVVIDRAGVVRNVHIGFSPELAADLRADIDPLL